MIPTESNEKQDKLGKSKVKRMTIVSKYYNKKCALTSELRCTVGMCAVAKCDRVQEISGIRDPITQCSGRNYESVIDRVIGKKR